MVRNYVRRTNRQQWDEDVMAVAVQAVVSQEMAANQAAQVFNVPGTTLYRYVRMKRATMKQGEKPPGKLDSMFSMEQESELASYLGTMQSWFDGLTMKDVRDLAYQLADRHGLGHRFLGSDGLAGEDWVKGFLTRHPEFQIRKTSSKCKGFAVESYADFCSRHQLTAGRIFNCGGVGISVSPGKRSRVLALKGEGLVGTESGTAVLCMSAAGSFMPPMLVLPAASCVGFGVGMPIGAWAKPHPSGCLTNELFLAWFQKFVEFSGAKKESPVLLMARGLSAFTRNLRLIEKARESGVSLLCLPPKTAHGSQPMDAAFLRPLSEYYTDECRKLLAGDPRQMFNMSHVSPTFGAAFLRAAVAENAINGFKVTGIWPIDRGMFLTEDLPDESESSLARSCDSPTNVKAEPPTEAVKTENPFEEFQPGCSSWASK